MDLWIHLLTFVRSYVPIFLKIRALEFSDFLYWKMSKKVFAFSPKIRKWSLFGQKWTKIGLFGPKCPKIGSFHIFFWNCILEFPNFCRKSSIWSQKILRLWFFGEIWKMAFCRHLAHWSRLAKKFRQKFWINFILIFLQKSKEKTFRGKKIHLYPSNSPDDLPLPTLRKFFKWLKRRFFAFFFKKKFKIFYFIIILVEIWLVELKKLKFVVFNRQVTCRSSKLCWR